MPTSPAEQRKRVDLKYQVGDILAWTLFGEDKACRVRVIRVNPEEFPNAPYRLRVISGPASIVEAQESEKFLKRFDELSEPFQPSLWDKGDI